MPTPQLSFVVNCGVLGPAEIDAVLALVEANPFGRCEFFYDDSDAGPLGRQPYMPELLAALLQGRPTFDVTVCKEAAAEFVTIDCRQRSGNASFSVTVASAELEQRHAEFLAYARAWVRALPKVASGRIGDGNADWPALYEHLNLASPPACFTLHLHWVHYLGPGYYPLFLTKDELLAAPAHRVTSLDEGVIEMIVYPEPFGWSSPEAERTLVELTAYLDARDRFGAA